MKISAFNRYQMYDIPKALHLLAEQIEHGDEYIRCVICLERPDGTVDYRAFGEDFAIAYALGLLVAAQAMLIKDIGLLTEEP